MAHVGYPVRIGSPEDLARRAGRLRNPIDRERAEGLSKDARDSIRQLKLKHREAWKQDPKDFRKLITEATGKVTRLKPGPATDPKVRAASHDCVKAGPPVNWAALFLSYHPDYTDADAQLVEYAADSFRAKVRRYIREHSYLKREWDKKVAAWKHRKAEPSPEDLAPKQRPSTR